MTSESSAANRDPLVAGTLLLCGRVAAAAMLGALLFCTSCEREAVTSPQTMPDRGLAFSPIFPTTGPWADRLADVQGDTARAWLYVLGSDDTAPYRIRPRPGDPQSSPVCSAWAVDAESLVLETEQVSVATWWRIFVGKGSFLGQTTFMLFPEDLIRTVVVVLAPTPALANRVAVYQGFSLPESDDSPDRKVGGGRDVLAGVFFPIGIENLITIDGISLRFTLPEGSSCAPFLDPGSRLFASGSAGGFQVSLEEVDALGTGTSAFRLGIQSATQQGTSAEIGGGTDVLLYVLASGGTSPDGLCVDPDSAFFYTDWGTARFPVAVSNLEGCYSPPPCEIAVTHPIGGEVFCEGDPIEIGWTAADCCGDSVTIDLQRNGSFCSAIATVAKHTSPYFWSATHPCGFETDGYTIRISDPDGPASDQGDLPFMTYPACTLALLSPAGGEAFCEGDPVEIAWTAADCCGDSVTIELLRNGSLCAAIATVGKQTSPYFWSAAHPCGPEADGYTIRISDPESETGDQGDLPFVISPSCTLALLNPGGGDVFCEGDPVEIAWTAADCCGDSVTIDLQRNGSFCSAIATVGKQTSPYLWSATHPCGPETDGYTIRISDPESETGDQGDLPFMIFPSCSLALLSPAGGEAFCEGDPIEIAWTAADCCGDSVTIELLRNGSLCYPIATVGKQASPYFWTAAHPCGPESYGYAIRIRDPETPIADQDSGPFAILGAGPETFVYHHDGSFENGVCWSYAGSVPPYYGAFGEAFDLGPARIHGAAFWATHTGDFHGQPTDVYIWEGGITGQPGAVLCLVPGVVYDNVPIWPSVGQNDVDIECTTSGAFTVGCWADFSAIACPWYLAADEDGFDGYPWTCIAPGIGYPTGWQDPSLVWGPIQSLGIGVYVSECSPAAAPSRETSFRASKPVVRPASHSPAPQPLHVSPPQPSAASSLRGQAQP